MQEQPHLPAAEEWSSSWIRPAFDKRRAELLTLAVLTCLLFPLGGCGETGQTHGPFEVPVPEQGAVAKVDGVPISADDVSFAAQVLAGGSEGAPTTGEALTLAKREALLAAEAGRAGYHTHPSVERASRRALVQAYLTEVIEKEADEVPQDQSTLRDFYDQNPARFSSLERRTASVLCVPEEEAEALLQYRAEVLLGPPSDPRAVVVHRANSGEVNPPSARDLIFGLPEGLRESDVERPGERCAVNIESIEPAEERAFEEVLDEVAEVHLELSRRRLVLEHVGELQAATEVHVYDGALELALQMEPEE